MITFDVLVGLMMLEKNMSQCLTIYFGAFVPMHYEYINQLAVSLTVYHTTRKSFPQISILLHVNRNENRL